MKQTSFFSGRIDRKPSAPRFPWALFAVGLVVLAGPACSQADNNGAANGKNAEKTPGVKLSPDEINAIGLKVKTLETVSQRPRQRAFGVVVDLQSLMDAGAALADSQAQATKSAAALEASTAEYERAQKLHGDEGNLSTKELQSAESAFRADEAAARSAQAALQAHRLAVTHQWGPVLTDWMTSMSPEYRQLAKGEKVLVRVALTGASQPAKPPETASLQRPDGSWVQAPLVSPTAQVSPEFQSGGYFFLAPAEGGLLSGLNVNVMLPPNNGAPVKSGVIVPASAVVWWEGNAWVYLQGAPGVFVRQQVDLSQPDESGGYFVEDFPADKPVAVTAAQSLLTEEFEPAAD